ncbi:MAG: potassium-transporting ATPase subunit KdpA [Gammaproteobacteria bacterium]|nr:potassium-transporting ATPase subunit KdpA [Gammaproteobacteria bacterium]
MTTPASALLIAFLATVLVLVKPLGGYIAAVMEGADHPLLRIGRPLERAIYRVCGIDPQGPMGWKSYAIALLAFNAAGAVLLYALQRTQARLPLDLQHFANVRPAMAFNTAVSFVTNTNWQSYDGETTMSDLTQMAGLAVQNFLSAATGLVVAIALIRGFARRESSSIGNCWADLTRAILYVLLPLSLALALALAATGVIQNLHSDVTVRTLEGAQAQVLPMGPVASQEAIKELGTNGGGFFNANSAHPYENPTPLSNFLEMVAIALIPAALTYTFGRLVGDTRQGWAVLAAMLILFVGLAVLATSSEQHGNPRLAALGVDAAPSALQPGGNMEGKESRFGIAASALFATVTTGTSCGAVNSMHDSYLPLGGLVPLFNMMLGEVVLGGVGTGLYSILLFAIVGVFIAGLMIGRTPEYLGKKIESFEMKMCSIAILVMPVVVLVGTAVAVSVGAGRAGTANPGAHGFSEILYAFTSAGNNNGSAFAGLAADTRFYDLALGIAMWLGRYWPIVAVLAVAGSLAAKKRVPVTPGTLPTHGPTFVVLLLGAIVLVGALTFVPALALGPIVEHLTLWGTVR